MVTVQNLRDPAAPIFPLDRRPDQLVPDSFIVVLRRRYGLEDHFEWIGLDLRTVGLDFRPLRAINGYRVRLTWNCIHQLIIFDPHVDRILQDARVVLVPSNSDSSSGSDGVLGKRQMRRERSMPWHVKMLTVGQAGTPIQAQDSQGVCGRPRPWCQVRLRT